MGSLQKFWSYDRVENCSKYPIFLAIPTNLLLWLHDRKTLHTSLLRKLEVFIHRIIQHILGISMYVAKQQHITNETVGKILFDMLQHQTTYRNTTANLNWKSCTQLWRSTPHQDYEHVVIHKRKLGGVIHTNKKSIVKNLFLVIPWVKKKELSKHGHTLPLMKNTGVI